MTTYTYEGRRFVLEDPGPLSASELADVWSVGDARVNEVFYREVFGGDAFEELVRADEQQLAALVLWMAQYLISNEVHDAVMARPDPQPTLSQRRSWASRRR